MSESETAWLILTTTACAILRPQRRKTSPNRAQPHPGNDIGLQANDGRLQVLAAAERQVN